MTKNGKKTLKAKDIERLENTSVAAAYAAGTFACLTHTAVCDPGVHTVGCTGWTCPPATMWCQTAEIQIQ